ncbi:iron-containing redox enzyme family protein [Sphaerisporangium melleum]|uniref:iron-containing redox enzyme family protein n=1 Tax=Sphaerisporangium melleum TaxID=321316 RepID=UPI001E50D641|nr:iron-containing redox enzyme family protein [Sphaerisporangium melleum]
MTVLPGADVAAGMPGEALPGVPAGGREPPRLPEPRGPLSAFLFGALTRAPYDLPEVAVDSGEPALFDEDLQIALHVCYELHYRGFDGVDERWEWHPPLLALRARLERRLEEGLAETVARPEPVLPRELPKALTELTAGGGELPPLADFLQHRARPEQFREFVVHRSIYHLKEADPHTFAIPRLSGPAKALLVEIQADEYGGGRPERMHAELYRQTMRGLGLPDAYGTHLDLVPAITLAVGATMSLFGLHRRHRGALLGHLAALEMTSSRPNVKYARGLRRLGAGADTARFYDEHVQADAVHEQVAAQMCAAFAAAEPAMTGEVLYGAACCLTLDRLFAAHLLDAWKAGTGSLRGERRG